MATAVAGRDHALQGKLETCLFFRRSHPVTRVRNACTGNLQQAKHASLLQYKKP